MQRSNLGGTRRRTLAGLSLIVAPAVLAAGIAFLPPLAGDWEDVLPRLAANETGLLVADLLIVAGIVLLIPGALGLLRVLGHAMPRLAPVAVALFLVGWLFVLGPVMLDRVQLQIAKSGLPSDQAVALVERLEADAGIGVVFGIFIIGHTLGAILLGIALVRTKFVAAWAGVSVVAAAVVHPIARVALGSKWLDVAAFLLLALGLGVAGLRVLRLSDDGWQPRPEADDAVARSAQGRVAARGAA